MITLRRAGQRHHIERPKRDTWLAFHALDKNGLLADGFGMLETFNESQLAPGEDGPLEPCHDAEVVTYVVDGAVTHEDSAGSVGILHAGEFQHRTASRSMRRGEANASRTDSARVFHIWLRPTQLERDPSHERKRFSAAERRGVLRVVASPDGRKGSLILHQDAQLYSAILDRGQHVVHELTARRSAWLHVVRGEATLGDLVLSTGDGVGITAERAVSLTARVETEVLLLDLGESTHPVGARVDGP